MTITQEHESCNSLQLKGNIIPHEWYRKITGSGGKADTASICLLSELLFLYRSTGLEEHQKDYSYFSNKFNLSTYQIREAFIRLEALNLMRRRIGTTVVQGRTFGNILYVVLHVKELLKLSDQHEDYDCDSDHSDFQQDSKDEPKEGANFFSDRLSDSNSRDLACTDARYIEENNLKDRSRSNFQNVNLEKNNKVSISPDAGLAVNQLKLKKNYGIGKSLAEFHPLSLTEVSELQEQSKRAFNANFINALLLRLSTKYPDKLFYSRRGVLSYMSLALQHEMRQAVQVNNTSFKFDSFDGKVAEDKRIEQYLQSVEDSKETDLITQLRKKIAGRFDSKIGYGLLFGSSFAVKHNSITITTQNEINLDSNSYNILEAQICSVFGDQISDFCLKSYDQKNKERQYQARTAVDSRGGSKCSTSMIWGKVRNMLKQYYGEGVDKSWFSKLSVEEDQTKKTINIKAQTKFIRDYVSSHYERMIRDYCKEVDWQLGELV